MATIDVVAAYGEQTIKIERILQEVGVTGNVGRVVLILALANSDFGVSQKEVVEGTALPKDTVSKLIGSLVGIKLLNRDRDSTNSRMKRISTTESGRKLLVRVRAALQPTTSPAPARPGRKSRRLVPPANAYNLLE